MESSPSLNPYLQSSSAAPGASELSTGSNREGVSGESPDLAGSAVFRTAGMLPDMDSGRIITFPLEVHRFIRWKPGVILGAFLDAFSHFAPFASGNR